jgi:tetratricopeptide (TPR) repeat protein
MSKALIQKGDYEAAIRCQDTTLEYLRKDQAGIGLHQFFYLGLALFYARHYAQAFSTFDSIAAVDPTNTWSLLGQAYKAGQQGNKSLLLQCLRMLEDRNIVDAEMLYRFAHFYLYAGDTVRALKCLDNSVTGGFFNYPYLRADPLLEGLRNSARYAEILEAAKRRHEAFKERFGRFGKSVTAPL